MGIVDAAADITRRLLVWHDYTKEGLESEIKFHDQVDRRMDLDISIISLLETRL